jgi:hypothetical protein
MEAVAFVAGEPWSDHPECACPVIGEFLRTWNDGLPDDERETLLKPLVMRLVGTRNKSLEQRRALMAADWLIREYTPDWLRLAGLTEHATALAALPEITDFDQCPPLMPALTAAKKDAFADRDAAWAAAMDVAWDAADAAAAAGDAARAAAGDAADEAAWEAAEDAAEAAADAAAWLAVWVAARDAAWEAAMDVAGDAAMAATQAAAAAWQAAWNASWVAAGAAARDAARDAAWIALTPTRIALQKSALRLVDRMIEAR